MWKSLSRIWWQCFRRQHLVTAIRSGDAKLVTRLLEKGINPNLVVRQWSLLTHALYSENAGEIVDVLLKHGARFECRGNDEFLQVALHCHRELVVLGCRHGLDISKRTKYGDAVLDVALRFQDPELIDFIMELGAEPKVHCVRWFAVNSPVILRLLAWGVPVPEDVRQSVEAGTWDRKASIPEDRA